IVSLLVRSQFRPPRLPFSLLIGLPSALGIAAATAFRSTNARVWRAGILWGAYLGLAMAVRMVVDIMAPFDIEGFLIEQARNGFSVLVDYPRRTLLGIAIVTIFMGVGCREAWKAGGVRQGTLAAMTASVVGFLITLLAAGLRIVFAPNQPGIGIDVPVWG